MPQLFFTSDNGPNPATLTRLERVTTEHDYFRDAGISVLFAYDDLLTMLEGDNVGDLRLQNGLAAAVAGLSAREFSELSMEMQESHRRRFVRAPLHQQLVPDLAIYLGASYASQDKLATSERIQFGEIVQELESYPWNAIRDEERPPTAWDSATRSMNRQARYLLFLSGIFVAWPTRWLKESPLDFATSKSKLLLHLKVTLYHQLAYHLRNLVCLFILGQP
jgi:hypothetical protein